jgi:hypothetical protein
MGIEIDVVEKGATAGKATKWTLVMASAEDSAEYIATFTRGGVAEKHVLTNDLVVRTDTDAVSGGCLKYVKACGEAAQALIKVGLDDVDAGLRQYAVSSAKSLSQHVAAFRLAVIAHASAVLQKHVL